MTAQGPWQDMRENKIGHDRTGYMTGQSRGQDRGHATRNRVGDKTRQGT